MPAPYLKSLRRRFGVSKKTLEKYWDQAKEIAKKQYGGVQHRYGVVTRIFQNKLAAHSPKITRKKLGLPKRKHPERSKYQKNVDEGKERKIDVGDMSVPEKELEAGIAVEMEHLDAKMKKLPLRVQRDIARKIAIDHLAEDPRYYQKLKKIDPRHEAVAEAAPSGTKESLNYRKAESEKRRCDHCSYYNDGWCSVLKAKVGAAMVCDAFARKTVGGGTVVHVVRKPKKHHKKNGWKKNGKNGMNGGDAPAPNGAPANGANGGAPAPAPAEATTSGAVSGFRAGIVGRKKRRKMRSPEEIRRDMEEVRTKYASGPTSTDRSRMAQRANRKKDMRGHRKPLPKPYVRRDKNPNRKKGSPPPQDQTSHIDLDPGPEKEYEEQEPVPPLVTAFRENIEKIVESLGSNPEWGKDKGFHQLSFEVAGKTRQVIFSPAAWKLVSNDDLTEINAEEAISTILGMAHTTYLFEAEQALDDAPIALVSPDETETLSWQNEDLTGVALGMNTAWLLAHEVLGHRVWSVLDEEARQAWEDRHKSARDMATHTVDLDNLFTKENYKAFARAFGRATVTAGDADSLDELESPEELFSHHVAGWYTRPADYKADHGKIAAEFDKLFAVKKAKA